MTQFVCFSFFVFCFLVFLVFLRGGNRCLPQHRGDGFSLITKTQGGVGKPEAITD